MSTINDSLAKKTARNTVVYGIVSVISGATGSVLLASQTAPILGAGLVAFGIAGFGWSCVARDWFFKSKKD